LQIQPGGKITTGDVAFHVADTLAIANGLDSATTIEATKSTAWSYQLYSTGGRGTITWTKATGTYPAGLSLSTGRGDFRNAFGYGLAGFNVHSD
jgi:hypothetical protein